MRQSREKMEALRAEITGELRPGQDLVVTKWIALAGTGMALQCRRAQLREYFSESFLRTAGSFTEDLSVQREWEIAEQSGDSARYALGEGGILAGLWKMAEAGETGLDIQLRDIPVRQETVEICERLDLNPYQLDAGGSLLIGTDRGAELVQILCEAGIPAVIIGRSVKRNGRILHNQEHVRYLDRPRRDEKYKLTDRAEEGESAWQS